MVLDPVKRQQILDNKDMPPKVIAETVGVGINTVYYVLQQAGITRAKKFVKRVAVFKDGVPVTVSWDRGVCVVAIKREEAKKVAIQFS